MNKDEILSMEAGREMDVLIEHHVFQKDVEWHPFTEGQMLPMIATDEAGVWVGVSLYSTNIEAAWSAVEEMRSKGVAFTITTMGSRNETMAFTIINGKHGPSCWASTPPLAICRAALMATMEA